MVPGVMVYLVTRGCYSEYSVLAVCSTREKAKVAVSVLGGQIEEFELDAVPQAVAEGFWWWTVSLAEKAGSVVNTGVERETRELRYSAEYIGLDPAATWSGGYSAVMHLTVRARDAGHAVKLASEKRALVIAAGVTVTKDGCLDVTAEAWP